MSSAGSRRSRSRGSGGSSSPHSPASTGWTSCGRSRSRLSDRTVLYHAYAAAIGDGQHSSAFGHDAFGRRAEKAARFFGTPQYILGQTVAVVIWIGLNSIALVAHWDPYPFILLNLAFSTQAAYAAPLILLAQTRQAERDKVAGAMLEKHRDDVAQHYGRQQATTEKTAEELKSLLQANTDLTQQDKELTEEVAKLTREIHAQLGRASG